MSNLNLFAKIRHALAETTSHLRGLDCNTPACGPCSFKRAFPERKASR